MGHSIRSLFQMNFKGVQYSKVDEGVDEWNSLPEPVVKDLGRQVLSQLAELHDLGVFHRDIKPDNILVDNQAKPALLILARQDKSAAETAYNVLFPHQPGGTVGFISSESFREEAETLSADVFAFGMTLLEMLTGKDRFEFWDENKTTKHFEPSFKKIKAAAGLTRNAQELIFKMVSVYPDKRPTSKEALSYPFFAEESVDGTEDKGVLEISSDHRQALVKLLEAEVALEKFDSESKLGSSRSE